MLQKSLKIVEHAKIYWAISILVILLGGIFLIVNGGFAMDIDFAGGMSMTVDFGEKAEGLNLDEVKDLVKEVAGASVGDPVVQRSDNNQVVIQTVTVENDIRDQIQNKILEKYELAPEAMLATDNVSATVGGELQAQAVQATLIASLLMLLYITIRFEFKTGVAAIVALLHDCAIMLSFCAIFRIPLNTTLIAAILTIIGYSINNTIVVFDRVRENYKRAKHGNFNETVNNSVKQTLSRSICTTITTLLPVVMLFALGVSSIRQFTIPLIVGLLAGTYSSVLLAAPVWAGLKKWQDKLKRRKLHKR
ncbi:MAG: protein translocase subunit SecF [Clostridia bacterium]|nr:protein translocase subunit SecF [Clostridia bacterium]